MFCYQCQEAAGGTACTASGVCGKTADVADLQDLLVYTLSGVSTYAAVLNANGIDTASADAAVTEGLFATITNANFDPRVFVERVFAGLALRERLREQWRAAGFSGALPDAATWSADTEAQLVEKAASVGVLRTENEDVRSLRELVVYGVKGMAAYAHHAARLGANDPEIYAFMHRALAATLDDSLTADELVGLVLE
ncbi:MAG TPA: hydroxylamine reductase, partial [Spirochaetota bacterium]|nr:hydroxylamine reductase [Spirochaetota bacterium]